MKSRRRLNHIIVLALWLLNYETTANVCNASQSHNNDQMKSDAKECGIGNSSSPNKGAYQWDPEKIQPCSIVQMTWKEIKTKFGSTGLPPMYPHPLVIKEGNRNTKFRSSCQKDQILDFFPSDFPVTLSSSNSFSEHRRTIPLRQYMFELEEQVQQLPNQLSNETWYLFGETYSEQWKQFLSNYELPICEACQADSVALSFGIGNRGSGVQWHVHGPGFSEAIVGRKHWILYKDKPSFHKDQTSRNWMEHNYLAMAREDRPFECTLDPGDVIYFPNMWWHATINLDTYTAFVSTFTQEHLFVGYEIDSRETNKT